MSEALAIGIDVGGTKIEGLLVDVEEGGRILNRRLVDTPAQDAEGTVRATIEVARSLAEDGHAVRAVGAGAAGLVDLDGVMRFAPNIAFREVPLRARLEEALGVHVLVDNDANVAAWGEFRFGAGKDVDDMLLVTVGTGIGGGIVAGGKLFRGAHGFAAEIGHIIVEPGGPLCGCGNLGCWEQVASGRAIGRKGREAARDHPRSLMVELASGDPEAVDGPIVTEAARQEDPVARTILAEVGWRLGEGIAGLVNVLDPELVVVGGGVAEAGEHLLESARRALYEAVEGPDHRPEVRLVAADLGNDAGALGAAALAFEDVAARTVGAGSPSEES